MNLLKWIVGIVLGIFLLFISTLWLGLEDDAVSDAAWAQTNPMRVIHHCVHEVRP